MKRRAVDGIGVAPHDRDMEPRIHELEKATSDVRERLARIEASLSHMATGQALEKLAGATGLALEKMGGDLRDLIEAQNARSEAIRSDLIKWFVGTALIIGALAFTAAKYTSHQFI
jgi:ABC-type Fe2+-enterobactin transport system substrate-binding protein